MDDKRHGESLNTVPQLRRCVTDRIELSRRIGGIYKDRNPATRNRRNLSPKPELLHTACRVDAEPSRKTVMQFIGRVRRVCEGKPEGAWGWR